MRSKILALTALALTLIQGGSAMADPKTDIEKRNKSTVEASFEAWRAGAGGPFALLADDASWTITGRSDAAGTYPSREAFMSRVIGPFNARMSQGLKPTIRQIHAEGDAVVVLFDAAGVAKDGQPYVNTYAWFFEMKADKVVKATAFYDSLAFNDLWRRVSPTP